MSRDLSEHQKKRIRRADAEDLARMVKQEAYWTEDALTRMLSRVEILSRNDPEASERGARSAIQVLTRLVAPPPDLQSFALATHGSTLRALGRYDKALDRYIEASAVDGLSHHAYRQVFKRKATALVCNGQIVEGLNTIERVLRDEPDDVPSLAVRSWVRLILGDYPGTLEDCMAVLERAHARKDQRSFLAGIVNASAVLRMEAPILGPDTVNKLLKAVTDCRSSIPKSGSSFYSLTLPRALLYHAEALLIAQQGHYRDAARLLVKAFNQLADKFPDEAYLVAVDLTVVYAKNGQGDRAAQTCVWILEAKGKLSFQVQRRGWVVAGIVSERGTLSEAQAIELRALLLPI